ncbi:MULTISPECIES: hypothetical protein [unclassified Coleofasciculus]|uniref:hypothetical protein n=1 Tax=unclassified Coleofasciculus TaxID=2692782 RepID=UPI001D13A268|nr:MULTISPECIES: hypothetical protein [unclassified Coleofasciculus]
MLCLAIRIIKPLVLLKKKICDRLPEVNSRIQQWQKFSESDRRGLAQLKARQEAELTHQQALANLELEKAERMAEITSTEYRQKVEAIDPETIKAIAQAGPEMQARLLEGLGIQSVLITDGKNPINLFGAANGLISPMSPRHSSESVQLPSTES